MPALVLADAHALGIVAVGPEGRGAAGADPLVAALVAFLLLLQALLQGLHQLLEAAQRLDLGLLLVGEELFCELLQPFRRDVRHQVLVDPLEALEDMGEDPVELVEVPLVLHQGGAGQVVEVVHVQADDVAVHRLHQGEVFPQGHRHLGVAKLREKAQEHAVGTFVTGDQSEANHRDVKRKAQSGARRSASWRAIRYQTLAEADDVVLPVAEGGVEIDRRDIGTADLKVQLGAPLGKKPGLPRHHQGPGMAPALMLGADGQIVHPAPVSVIAEHRAGPDRAIGPLPHQKPVSLMGLLARNVPIRIVPSAGEIAVAPQTDHCVAVRPLEWPDPHPAPPRRRRASPCSRRMVQPSMASAPRLS